MPFSWIITKSQPHADSVVIQLRRNGFEARAIPCIEHRWRDWPELRSLGANRTALLFVTSRATAARVDVPKGTTVAAIAPTTSATLEARGIPVTVTATGGVRELASAVIAAKFADGTEVFYPTSEAALRQPEHLDAVATLGQRLRVNVQPVYSTEPPDGLAAELAGIRSSAGSGLPPGYAFWSPSAIANFAAAGGFELPPGPVVLVGGSTERHWSEHAPAAWRRAFRHDAETPLEWSLRFLERGVGS